MISVVRMEQYALRCSLLLFSAIFLLLNVIFDKVSDDWQLIKASTPLINQKSDLQLFLQPYSSVNASMGR